ncbi:MAG: hypothetical protein A2Y57_04810 [Candidatus Woykebacteria bacterium RBG_13_40_7b]|uniref:Beta-lactamase class A catalytic domain-containing protein n=1 Tax=Candidatus Woykebacteria bacterium RBG_13_40_7b TaxID=1802594 RepID=A0A1G1WCC3_9BACT|nr:MAG: hypothetical protein A2Y57_04810 [Candidatus Woykebacteria bacterium RBG_13_40_7b]
MRRRYLTYILTVIVVVLMALVAFLLLKGRPSNLSKEKTVLEKTDEEESDQKLRIDETVARETLMKGLNETIAANQGTTFGIYLYDLNKKAGFGIGETQVLHTASVSKVLTGVYLLQQVEAGKVRLDQQLGAYNVDFQLQQLINRSNNDSWDLLDQLLGYKPQEDYAKGIGLTTFNIDDNLMSPYDAGLLFIKLYQGELLNDVNTKKLLSYMRNTEAEQYIPKGLPKETSLYHKTGQYEGEAHDVAIVEQKDNPFVLSIFTSNQINPDYDARAKVIQKITKEVYNYFNSI